jgi:hypothetical protein
MPPVAIALAAAVAGGLAASAVGAAVTGAVVLGITVGATGAALIGGLVGAVVATGVSYAGSALLGLNRPPKASGATAPSSTAQDRRQMVRSTVEPRKVVYGRARVSGPMVYASSSGADQRFLHLIVPLAGHTISGWEAAWINDYRVTRGEVGPDGIVTTGPLANVARIRVYDGKQTSADPDLVAESLDGWSDQHVGRGVAYLYVRLEYDQQVFPNGLQNVAAEIYGKDDIFDPRTGFTAYTENAALCIRDYLRGDHGMACAADELDDSYWSAAANVCDERVQIAADGSTEARFLLNGSFSTDATPLDIMDQMLTSCAGVLVYVAGKYRLHVGAYAAPTDTLTASDLAGAIEVQTKPPRKEVFNAVRGTFVDAAKLMQASDFPPVADASFAATDGEVIWKDIDLPFTVSGTAAQRLARLALNRAREGITLRAPVQYRGIRYCVWQMLSVTLADFGWVAKPFRVTAWTFDPASGIVTLVLREESAASYAWDYASLGTLSRAPDTALADPFAVPAPQALAVAEELYVSNGGASVRTRAILTWQPPAFPFVSGYEAQFRPVAEDAWRPLALSAETRANADDLADGLYAFRVRARSLVAFGAWAEVQASIGGLAAVPPAAVTGLAVQQIGGFAYLRWDEHPDLDVRVGGAIEFRHTPDTVSPTWVGSTGIGDAVPGGSSWTILPLKAGTYLAKARDQGGRYSAAEATIGAAQATALAWTSLSTLTEHTAFTGAKTNTIVTSSTLRLDTSGDVDAETDFDAIADLDGLGGVLPSGSYAFSGGMDLTTVRSVRLTGLLKAVASNTLANVDSRAELVDDWLSWDDIAGGEADAWIEVRQTDDNPSGSPTWSAWRRLDASEFRARAYQFRAQLRSYDVAFNIHVSELSVTAEEVA